VDPGLGEDRLQVDAGCAEADTTHGSDLSKILTSGKPHGNSCLRWGETECLPQDGLSGFPMLMGIDDHQDCFGPLEGVPRRSNDRGRMDDQRAALGARDRNRSSGLGFMSRTRLKHTPDHALKGGVRISVVGREMAMNQGQPSTNMMLGHLVEPDGTAHGIDQNSPALYHREGIEHTVRMRLSQA